MLTDPNISPTELSDGDLLVAILELTLTHERLPVDFSAEAEARGFIIPRKE